MRVLFLLFSTQPLLLMLQLWIDTNKKADMKETKKMGEKDEENIHPTDEKIVA